MRALSLLKEALAAVFSSAAVAGVLFVCIQELTRPPGVEQATLGGMLPITTYKSPWWLLIALVLFLLWWGLRSMGGQRGVLWGMCRWLLRVGMWWSVVALLTIAGVLIDGAFLQPISDLRWPFALTYIALSGLVFGACKLGLTQTG